MNNHERTDAQVRPIALFGVGLAALTVVVLLLIFGLQAVFERQKTRNEVPPSPLAPAIQVPPEPHLQVTPEVDLQRFQASQDSILNSYGWVLREAGVVRIPIRRAMELVGEKGLPVRSGNRESKIEDGGSRP